MSGELPTTLQISKTILERVGDASVSGNNGFDEEGQLVVQLGIQDGERRRLRLSEGETFDFAGATWAVTKIEEPNTETRGAVATLTRVGEGGAGGG